MKNSRKWITVGLLALVLIAAGLVAMVIFHGGTKPVSIEAELSQLASLQPSTTIQSIPSQPPITPGSTPEVPVPLPEAAPPVVEMTASSTNPPSGDQDKLLEAFPGLLSPDEFPYQAIPFEAKLVEFPIVLLDQHFLKFSPVIIMDPTLGLQEEDPMALLRANVYRIEKPPVTPPPRPQAAQAAQTATAGSS